MLDHPYSFVAIREGASLWPGADRAGSTEPKRESMNKTKP